MDLEIIDSSHKMIPKQLYLCPKVESSILVSYLWISFLKNFVLNSKTLKVWKIMNINSNIKKV